MGLNINSYNSGSIYNQNLGNNANNIFEQSDTIKFFDNSSLYFQNGDIADLTQNAFNKNEQQESRNDSDSSVKELFTTFVGLLGELTGNEFQKPVDRTKGTDKTDKANATTSTATEDEQDGNNINGDNIMETEAGSGELKNYSGEDLFQIYEDYVDKNIEKDGLLGMFSDNPFFRSWKGGNINNSQENTLLVKLLAGATEDQAKGFFNAMKEKYGEQYISRLGSSLNWGANVSDSEWSSFMNTANKFSDIFPGSLYKLGVKYI